MIELVALIIAVVALGVAASARSEARALRASLRALTGVTPDRPVQSPAPEVPEPPAPAEPVIARYEPPPPSSGVKTSRPASRAWNIDWENLVGIKLFSWIAGIALVLAAVFLFKYSVEHGWLRPSIRAAAGLVTGIGLLVVCELRVARNYRFTANAMDGAGIAILYATLFAMHASWHFWPAGIVFLAMLLVTATAVFLSTRRDSVFIALLGLIGGFATPALLASGENRPIALFSYLLLLNGGIAWIAYRKRWPLLTALTVGLTAFYQWSWVHRFLTTGQLPLAAAIFLVFAAVAASSALPKEAGERHAAFRRIAAAGAVLPLLFAFFTAVVPEYGAQFHVLFGFLLLVVSGLTAIALWRGPEWLHSLGGIAVLVTFFIWLTVSYTSASWPWSVVWLAAFVALFLGAALRLRGVAVYTSPLLFFVFIALSVHEPERFMTLTGAMFALLVIVVVFALATQQPYIGATAIGLAWIAVMSMGRAPVWLTIGSEALLLATALVIAWISRRHELAVAAVPFAIAALIAASISLPDPQVLLLAAILYALFLAYPATLGARAGSSLLPHFAAICGSVIFFIQAYVLRDALGYAGMIGFLPIVQALLLVALMWQLLRLDPVPARLVMVASAALAFLTIAALVQLDREWLLVAWSLEAAALAWLYTRISHRGLLWWSGGLAVVVLTALLVEPAFDGYVRTYLLCAIAMFAAARLAGPLRSLAASVGTIELFVFVNVAIGEFHTHRASSVLARDLTYTIAWVLFALVMLIAGLATHSRTTRVAALGLLLVTVLKCFLHDLARLGGLYRVASLFGLAASLVIVGLLLQKFVILRRESTT